MPKNVDDPPPGPPLREPAAVPPLQHVLEIARRGAADPSHLTTEDIRDLARTLLVHYAHMGIHSDEND